MSLARDFPNYNPYSSPPKFKREVKEYLFDLAKKKFNSNHTHMDGQCLREIKFKPR